MAREDFTLVHRLRVRWAEVDMQHVVFNANYLMYFDVGIAEYWRAIGRGLERELAEVYMRLYTVKSVLEYHAPARYDEEIDVGARVARFGRSSMSFAFGIWRGDAQGGRFQDYATEVTEGMVVLDAVHRIEHRC